LGNIAEMNEKQVLIISYYFPPMGLSGVQRTLKFVKYLPFYKWKPIVLTTSSANFYAFDETLSKELPEENYKVYRAGKSDSGFRRDNKYKIKKFPLYITQKIGRALTQTIFQPDSKRPWLKYALKKAEEIIKENNIDVIFATAPPFTDFLVAEKLSSKFGLPYIIDYRDVWIDNPFHFYATPFHKLYSIKLESKILTHAFKAIVTIRNTKELLLKRYRFLSHNDIEIIPHGFDPDDFDYTLTESKPKDKFIITHSGLFQDNRTPKYFLKAVDMFFKKRPEAKNKTELRFIGLMRKNHLKLIKNYGLSENVKLLGYLNHKETIKNILHSDVLWLMLMDNVRSPGKLYEYFAARKSILACVPDGSIKKLLEESEAAYITKPDDVNEIYNGLNTLYDLWKNDNLFFPKISFVEQFNRKILTGDLAKNLELAIDLK